MTDKICLLKYKLLAIQNGNINIYLKCKRAFKHSIFCRELTKNISSLSPDRQEQMSMIIFK